MEDTKQSGYGNDTGGEPLFINFISKMSGNVYDELVVDHIADMALIFYSGGGTALGAVAGACAGMVLVGQDVNYPRVLSLVPLCGFIGAISGALLVMWTLNLRGLLRWDGAVIKRTYRLKQKPS